MTEKIPTLIFGTSGASKDIYYWLKAVNLDSKDKCYELIGLIDNDDKVQGATFFEDIPVIGSDSDVSGIIEGMDRVALIVPFGNPYLRKKVVEKMCELDNVFFPNIIHPTAIYDPEAGKMGIGNHIGPGVILASEFTLGDFNYISIGARLGHDIKLGNYNSINPAASCAGNVVFGDRNTLSINATVIEEIRICDDVIIGGSAIVTKDINEPGTYVGVPFKKIK